jgi:hypothetical protein
MDIGCVISNNRTIVSRWQNIPDLPSHFNIGFIVIGQTINKRFAFDSCLLFGLKSFHRSLFSMTHKLIFVPRRIDFTMTNTKKTTTFRVYGIVKIHFVLNPSIRVRH